MTQERLSNIRIRSIERQTANEQNIISYKIIAKETTITQEIMYNMAVHSLEGQTTNKHNFNDKVN